MIKINTTTTPSFLKYFTHNIIAPTNYNSHRIFKKYFVGVIKPPMLILIGKVNFKPR